MEELKLILEILQQATPIAREMFYVYLGWKLVDGFMLWMLLFLGGKGFVKLVKYCADKVEN